MHAHGVDDSMEKVCKDLAEAGYYAVAMDSYLNQKYWFRTRTDDLIFSTYDVTLQWLEANEFADMNRLGSLGFCMGGRHSYLANAYYDNLKAAVSFYGFPHRGDDEDTTPQNLIEDFSAPSLSIFGGQDRGIPAEAVDNYRKASEKMDLEHRTIVYEDAGHGFLNHNSANHNKEAAEAAWSETLAFYEKYI